MDEQNLEPYRLDTALTGYMPIPRDLIAMGLPSTAMLIYAALLDRATLSQKNHYADAGGWVYVIYPVERLAEAFHISDTAVKRHLRELETRGLIHRRREVKNGASHIYLNLPSASCKGINRTDQKSKPTASTGRKVTPNNRRYQQQSSDYYQHGEDESL